MKSPYQIIALGEILWDIFPDRTCFGGAPANFACAISELGKARVNVQMVSGVGNDPLGDPALRELANHGVGTDYVQRSNKKTGEVRIHLDDGGNGIYEFASDVAWDNLHWNEDLSPIAQSADSICFGTLGQRCPTSASSIQRIVSQTRIDCLRVFDINLRFPHVVDEVIEPSLELCNVLKLNEQELPYLARLLTLSGSRNEILSEIEKRFDLKLIALTLGSAGAVLKSGDWVCEHCSRLFSVEDTVGAGDAFTASLTLDLLKSIGNTRGKNAFSEKLPIESAEGLEKLLINANEVAAFVCSQPGATPVFPDKLKSDLLKS